MNEKSLYAIPIVGVVLLAFFGLGFFIGHHWSVKSPYEPISEKVDTLFIRDTITSYKPKIVERRVVDSVLVPVSDTVRLRDTMFVYLEREQVVWQDSLSVVYASGILPQVDSVTHFTDRMVINKEIRIPVKVKPHWSFGVGAYGVATMDHGKVIVRPGVGMGIQYNIVSW